MNRAVLLLAVLTLAGCGTGEDKQQIRALLDTQQRTAVVTPEPTVADDSGFGVSEAELVSIAEVEDIDVDGDTAEARYDDGFVQRLRKVDGRWVIAGEEGKIRATLDAEREAWKARDWDALCGLRTGAARRALCPPEEVKSSEAGTDTTLGNEPIVTFDFKQRGPSEIVVDGDRATVRYDGETVTRLRKVNGRWLIAG